MAISVSADAENGLNCIPIHFSPIIDATVFPMPSEISLFSEISITYPSDPLRYFCAVSVSDVVFTYSVTCTPVITTSSRSIVGAPLVESIAIELLVVISLAYHPKHKRPYASHFAHWQPICAAHARTCLQVKFSSSGRDRTT